MSNVQSGESALKVLLVGAVIVTATSIFKTIGEMPETAKRELIRRLSPGISEAGENEGVKVLSDISKDISNPEPAGPSEINSEKISDSENKKSR
ncbi:hypothetical protein PV396_44745 [Streptomyces sp. ME02-8801-2C]|uniref:hypothetical protein n=1 Tax=Streptomyces sp. ME02-8801-2C TaxID=3028680 RepID=UPI0029A861DE|nr:hypothetical protein [Streptomyces sp. ME02-8801-2C]MDX3458952.1 hypothetical protein [Streptomyces sp. ME02-8801-2C]